MDGWLRRWFWNSSQLEQVIQTEFRQLIVYGFRSGVGHASANFFFKLIDVVRQNIADNSVGNVSQSATPHKVFHEDLEKNLILLCSFRWVEKRRDPVHGRQNFVTLVRIRYVTAGIDLNPHTYLRLSEGYLYINIFDLKMLVTVT